MLAVDEVEHVVARDAATGAGTGDVVGVDLMLGDQTPNHWREQPVVAAQRLVVGPRGSHGLDGCRLLDDRHRSSGHSNRRRNCRRRRSDRGLDHGRFDRGLDHRRLDRGLDHRRRDSGGLGGTDDGDDRADRHRVAFGRADLQHHAGHRRRHFGVDLVGADLEQRLIGSDRVAHLLEPARDRAFGDGLAQLREGDVGHGGMLL